MKKIAIPVQLLNTQYMYHTLKCPCRPNLTNQLDFIQISAKDIFSITVISALHECKNFQDQAGAVCGDSGAKDRNILAGAVRTYPGGDK